MLKLVSNQLSPNFTLADSVYAMGQIFCRKAPDASEFEHIFCSKNVTLTNSARTALALIIENLHLPKDKRIGIPAFICAVVATPFLQKGYQIEWIDTDGNGVISVKDFEEKSKNISLVVVPHIFGQQAPIEEIHRIAKQKNIFIIEDCAHLIPQARTRRGESELEAHVRIFSFGREKVISCVSGGAVVWNNFVGTGRDLSLPSKWWSVRHALQPFIFSLALPWWNLGGKCIPYIASKIKLLPRAVTAREKQGEEDFPLASLPAIQQNILLQQFRKAENIKSHRISLANAWKKTLTKLFPKNKIIVPENCFRVILHIEENREEFLKKSKSIGFDLHEWDGAPIAPRGVDLVKFGYAPGTCPEAEKFAKSYVTFPTNIRTNLRDVARFETLWGKPPQSPLQRGTQSKKPLSCPPRRTTSPLTKGSCKPPIFPLAKGDI